MIEPHKYLRTIDIAGTTVRRMLANVRATTLVLLEKDAAILRPKFDRESWIEFSTRQDCSTRLQNECDAWNRFSRFSYNCHTLAIGAAVGIGPEFWLEGAASLLTLAENPAQDLLQRHFTHVADVQHTDALPDMVRTDDVLVWKDCESGDLVHSARFRLDHGRPLLVSKLGEHPAAVTTYQDISEQYIGQFDVVQVYRYPTLRYDPPENEFRGNGASRRPFRAAARVPQR